jgi:hypothetical protein
VASWRDSLRLRVWRSVGVCSGCWYLLGDSAIQGAARLVVAPWAMAPAVASASYQYFGADRLGVGDLLRRLRFGDPRRRSRSVGASAPAPGSVARSSADVLTAPATRSGCPSVVDMVRGSFRFVRLAAGSMCFKL